jgi:hypothetical protein
MGSKKGSLGYLRSNKIVKENQDRGWFQVSQTSFSKILSAPTPHKVFESLCFSASVNFKAFFDKYFLVKSHLCVE